MSKTTYETNDPLKKKAYEEKLWRDSLKQAYFPRFFGESSSSMVHVKENLQADYGDEIQFGLRRRLTGAGVTGREKLEGKEERLNTDDYSLSLEQYRHGVRDGGALDRQRVMFSIDQESEDSIRDWGAEKIDLNCFDALFSDTAFTQIVYNSDGASGSPKYETTPATAIADLTATNSKIDLNVIQFCKVVGKTGHDRDFIPIRPVNVDGEYWYVLLTHPDVMFDLKTTSAYQQAQREARERGKSNPLFKGNSSCWDGVVIHEHENVPILTNGGGGSVPYAPGILMGQQALCWAWGQRPEMIEKNFDYENEHGRAWSMISKAGVPVYNSKNYGSIGMYFARTQVSDG